jgi:hypothetical protein
MLHPTKLQVTPLFETVINVTAINVTFCYAYNVSSYVVPLLHLLWQLIYHPVMLLKTVSFVTVLKSLLQLQLAELGEDDPAAVELQRAMEELAGHTSSNSNGQKRNSLATTTAVTGAISNNSNSSDTTGANSDAVLAFSDTLANDTATYDARLEKAATAKLLHQNVSQITDVATADVVGAHDSSVEVDVEVKWTGPSRWHSSHNKVCNVIIRYIIHVMYTV